MSAPAKAHEPTMEEILASIRRIISDDDPATGKAQRKPAAGDALVAHASEGTDDIDALFEAADAISAPPDLPRDHARAEAVQLRPSGRPVPSTQPELADDLDVFELTEEYAAPSTEEPIDFIERESEDSYEPETHAAPEQPASPERRLALPAEPLLSRDTDEAVSSAFGNLAHTILAGNARTIDDVVREMLRPMLRAWLDDNLPPLVERLVRQEIERVARGGR